MMGVLDKQEALLKGITEIGGWVTRAQLAAYLDKNRLNASETTMLDMLAAQGVIERQMRPVANAPHLNETLYRMLESPR